MNYKQKEENNPHKPPADKALFRQLGKSIRDREPDKDQKSSLICSQLFQLEEFIQASTVLFYVDAKGEVQTRKSIAQALSLDKKIVVPYCVQEELHLFYLQRMDELTEGAFQVFEPEASLREFPARQASISDIDFVVVPGLAFDKTGARLGYGIGYFDRLLSGVAPQAFLAGLAFECQLFESIPTQQHDILMHCVITEKAVYR